MNKYKEEQDGCDWYASGHTKNCVSVDKNGIGLTQLWRQMLSQFPLCGLETSEAIATAYGSPIALLEVSKKQIIIYQCYIMFYKHYSLYKDRLKKKYFILMHLMSILCIYK